jgi:hypothetical protein
VTARAFPPSLPKATACSFFATIRISYITLSKIVKRQNLSMTSSEWIVDLYRSEMLVALAVSVKCVSNGHQNRIKAVHDWAKKLATNGEPTAVRSARPDSHNLSLLKCLISLYRNSVGGADAPIRRERT